MVNFGKQNFCAPIKMWWKELETFCRWNNFNLIKWNKKKKQCSNWLNPIFSNPVVFVVYILCTFLSLIRYLPFILIPQHLQMILEILHPKCSVITDSPVCTAPHWVAASFQWQKKTSFHQVHVLSNFVIIIFFRQF